MITKYYNPKIQLLYVKKVNKIIKIIYLNKLKYNE